MAERRIRGNILQGGGVPPTDAGSEDCDAAAASPAPLLLLPSTGRLLVGAPGEKQQ